MKHTIGSTCRTLPAVLACAFALAVMQSPVKAEDPAPPVPPKVSTFAPAADLIGQVDAYVEAIQSSMGSESDYKDAQEQIVRDANTLAVLGLTLGLHDQENKYKAGATAIINATGDLNGAANYDAAKKAAGKLQAAIDGETKSAGGLKWTKVASLDQLMKQVPLVNNKLKRGVKGARLQADAKKTAGYSAVIAAIAQGSMANTDEAKTPDQLAQWYKFCIEMRDAAAAVNASIHAGNAEANTAAMAKLGQSCEDCHAVFHNK